ncbi:MAG: 23S rRNA (guanosine(2251)-2'-O)-methyltransferase RlmB [Thiovulaceae bacterium]|nr:23S rRNA (guanosine(2251)-2'-O)-methyltransferase RlmB [Sulfurimonadaceae bacterium]
MNDSKEYLDKKAFFERVITVYGRNVVVEVLEDENVTIHKLHLADSNKQDGVISTILTLAKKRGVEIAYHDKNALSRISKNAKQDQGVCADIIAETYKNANEIEGLKEYRLLALDGVQNPQNLGMIIRSAAAGNIDGIILPKKNSAKISPLVIKASAGTLFKIPIYYCNALEDVLKKIKNECDIFALSSYAKEDLNSLHVSKRAVFVLGNESEGISKEVQNLCNASVKIPMNRGVESLNVAVTAALISFLPR